MTDQIRNLRFTPDTIPAELTALPHWVAADAEKVPFNPATGRKASPTDPATWRPFGEAVTFAQRRDLDIGFGLTIEAGIVCLDLDHCRDPETGAIEAWAQAIVDRLASYTEPSRSGTGLHIYVTGTLPPGRRRQGQIEMYDSGRYVIVTGQPLPGRSVIRERTATLADLHRETFPAPPPPIPVSGPPLQLDDNELLERARRFAKFAPLFDHGDLGDVGGDHSAGDLTLCNLIVRAGADHAEQVDRIFRSSALCREKWDQRRGESTYGERTIARALDGTVVSFRPNPPRPTKPASCGLPLGARDLPDDIPGLKAVIADLTDRLEATEKRAIQAEQRAKSAERRADMLSVVQSKTAQIIRNKQLGQERMTAVALSHAFANREAAGDAGDNGLYAIPLGRIAEDAGVSEDAASRHVKKLVEAGVLRKELRQIRERIDTQTGEIIPAHKRQYIGPPSNVVNFVDSVAALAPTKSKNWGGTRTACPEHPDAGTVKRWSLHCAECDRMLDRGEDCLAPGAEPQVAVLGATPSDHETIAAPVVNHYRDRNRRVDYNNDAPPDSIAGAWQRGAALPGFDPSPPADRWTG